MWNEWALELGLGVALGAVLVGQIWLWRARRAIAAMPPRRPWRALPRPTITTLPRPTIDTPMIDLTDVDVAPDPETEEVPADGVVGAPMRMTRVSQRVRTRMQSRTK